MYLYLVRHGEAVSKDEDEAQPLSIKGTRDAERIAHYLNGITVERIYHSGKLRARETAEIFGEQLAVEPFVADGLNPEDDPIDWKVLSEDMHRDTMIVSHLPFLSKLASSLIFGNPDADFWDFQPGAVLCLNGPDIQGPKPWHIRWFICPEMLIE